MKCFLLTVVAVVAFQSIAASPIDLPNPVWHITAVQSNPGNFAQPFAVKNTMAATVTKGDVSQFGLILNEAALNQAGGDFKQVAPVNAGALNVAGETMSQYGLANAGVLCKAKKQDVKGIVNVQVLNTAEQRNVEGVVNVDLLNQAPDTTYKGLTVGRK